MKRKVCLIGRVAPNQQLFDGQTVKTRLLLNELRNNADWKIYVVDTVNKKHKIRMLIKSIYYLLLCRDVFICLSANGNRIYHKLLRPFIKIRRTRVYHYVVGGNYHNYLKNNPKFINISKRFRVNWVQTNGLVKELEKLGITNARYMPNFKSIKPVDISKVEPIIKPPFKFVIFSRIAKTKGIDVAAKSIEKLNQKNGYQVATLDCYGAIENPFKEEFENIVSSNSAVRYCGVIDAMKSGDALKNYFMLLFPTSWPGEGFAATILDAYFGGIPVIASDWNCNAEIVDEGKTGFIYPSSRFKTIDECIEYAVSNPSVINSMKPNCINYVKNFTPEKYIKEIIDFVEKQ